MVREVVTLNVGQCGIQMANAQWIQYCAEHGISNTGTRWRYSNDNSFTCFFEETMAGKYVPRNCSVDLEPNVLDDVRSGPYSDLYHPDFLLNHTEGAANNFARGYYTVGREIRDLANDRLRKLMDNCNNVQGIIVNHAVGGGTGSGLGCLLLKGLAVNYRKKSKLGFEVYPSPTISTCVVEPYNALLTTHWLLDHTEQSFLLDNEAIYELCQRNLDVKHPSYGNLNRLISKVVSSTTVSLRFDGEMNVDLNELQRLPFPRLHFMLTAMSPLSTQKKLDATSNTVQEITDDCVQPRNFLAKFKDFDSVEDRYMSIQLSYRGDVIGKEAYAAVQFLKSNHKVSFVEWCPTGFKIGLSDVPGAVVEDDDIGVAPRTVTMIGNNTGIVRVFTDRMIRKFDLMYSQRAYIHWYLLEGMEREEFVEAREDIGFLEKDYIDVLGEDTSEEGDDDDEY